MCTVTYIPAGKNIFITSNRDERPSRKIAYPPAIYELNGTRLYFPKDQDAGGTWMAVKENGDVAVLLNGAFIEHKPSPPYRMSRGILLLDLASQIQPSLSFSRTELSGIEPFTLILFEKNTLKEFRWDGEEKFYKDKPTDVPHLWCSATIYDGMETRKRVAMLTEFLRENPAPNHDDILNLHGGFNCEREDSFLVPEIHKTFDTVSISSIHLEQDSGVLKYYDLIQSDQSEINIRFSRMREFPK